MAENEVAPPALGISWDGTGYGSDGTIWGGEFLLIDDNAFTRVAHLRQFPLPGGDAAVKEPRRTALGLLYQAFGEEAFDDSALYPKGTLTASEQAVLKGMLTRSINSPLTSSAGRLFDAVASLLGLCHKATFEGEAAMALEFAIANARIEESYRFEIAGVDPKLVVDWHATLLDLLADRDNGVDTSVISSKFHNALVEMMIAVARRCGQQRVVLSGGCFQNAYLTERTIKRLREEGFSPYWHQRVPPNDGGIALGQIMAAARAIARK